MRVSEIRVKRIRVNQGLGVHALEIFACPSMDLKLFWTRKNHFWTEVELLTWVKRQNSDVKSFLV